MKNLTLSKIKKLYNKAIQFYDDNFSHIFFKGKKLVFDEKTGKMVHLILAKKQPKDQSKRVLDMRYKVNKEFFK